MRDVRGKPPQGGKLDLLRLLLRPLHILQHTTAPQKPSRSTEGISRAPTDW